MSEPAQDLDRIIAGSLDGDTQAYTQLLERYKGLVFQLAYQMSGNKEDALDITQEVFVKLYTQLHTYDHRYQFSSWLYRLTMNASIDHHRRQKRHKALSLHVATDDGMVDLPSGEPEPPQVSGKAELARIFRQLAAELPITQRAVFVLKDLEEKDSKYVATLLNITEATVRSHLHAARKKIRARLVERHGDILESFL